MSITRTIFLLILAVVMISCSQFSGPKFITDGNYTMESFKTFQDSLTEETDVINLCKEFMNNAEDMDLIREVQSFWQGIDEAAVAAYSKELAESNSNSAKYQYLYGRVVSSPIEKVEYGRKAVELDATFPYGYRLALATYSRDVISGDKADADYQQLSSMMEEDKAMFAKLAEINPKEVYSHQFLYGYQMHTNDFENAKITLDNAKALAQRWPSPMDYATVNAGMGQFADAKNNIRVYLTGQVDEKDLDSYIKQYYFMALSSAKQYDQVITERTAVKGYDKNPSMLYDLSCTYSLKGDIDNAFAHLTKASKIGWDQVAHTKRDTDLNAMHNDARWEPAVAVIQANWDGGKDERRKTALAEKVNDNAPTWSLEDINGKMVSLEDQKGKVIILDFWATWCGPCTMAMPVLDDFVKNKAPENVEVFSINVWEKGRNKPIKFMEENNYAMTLLYGNEDIVKDYGFRGIPYLCVIDQDGKIRFTHSGYSDGLGETLEFWIDDLL